MPSDLERAIAAQRKRLNAHDAEARARMRAAYEHALERIEREVQDVVRALETFPDSQWRMYHERRLRTLLDLAEAEYARFGDEAARILQAEQARAVSGGAQTAQEMAAASGISGPAFGVAINTPALERLVSSFAPGSPLRGVLDSYGTFGRKVIERELTDALIGGKSPREASRNIRRALGGDAVTARVDSLTRTELMRSFRGSLFEQFAQIGVTRWRWSASRSTRTCIACLAMDGRTFPMSRPFMAAHPNCRCVPSIDVDDDYGRGEDWLRRQSPERVRPMFPSADAHAAWERGEVGLDDFRGLHRDRTWGNSIHVRSWRDVRRRATA